MAELNITNNIPDTTAQYEYIGEGTYFPMYKITVTAADGVTIKSTPIPTFTYTDGMWGTETSVNMDVSADGKTATVESVQLYIEGYPNVTINGESEGSAQPTANVVNSISGTQETHTVDGGSVAITVSGSVSSNRFFSPKAQYTGTDGSTKTVDMTTTDSTAAVTITDADLSQPITLTGTYETAYYIVNNTQNCEVEGLKPYYKNGESVALTLTANSGYVFEDGDSLPKIQFASAFGTYDVYSVLQENNTKAVISWQMNEGVTNPNSGEYTLIGSAVESTAPPVGTQYGSINVYVVTEENLDALAKVRFVQPTGENGAVVDMGDYINRIKRIYTAVPVSGETTMMMGNYNTGITVKTPSTDRITLDFGSVTLPAPNGDLTDYESEFRLFLPFKGFVNISEDYAGKEITLQYVLSIITGEGVALLSYNGTVFQVEEVVPSLDVIYRTLSQDVRNVGGDSWNDFALYGTEPYVNVIHYISRSGQRNNDNKRTQIGQISGFAVLDDIDPIHTANMLSDEQDLIYRALSDGIYVKQE